MKMLEHQKLVLTHVSKDKNLFKKELFKSFAWLNKIDQVLLVKWIKHNFYEHYTEMIPASHPAFS